MWRTSSSKVSPPRRNNSTWRTASSSSRSCHFVIRLSLRGAAMPATAGTMPRPLTSVSTGRQSWKPLSLATMSSSTTRPPRRPSTSPATSILPPLPSITQQPTLSLVRVPSRARPSSSSRAQAWSRWEAQTPTRVATT